MPEGGGASQPASGAAAVVFALGCADKPPSVVMVRMWRCSSRIWETFARARSQVDVLGGRIESGEGVMRDSGGKANCNSVVSALTKPSFMCALLSASLSGETTKQIHKGEGRAIWSSRVL